MALPLFFFWFGETDEDLSSTVTDIYVTMRLTNDIIVSAR